MNPVVPSKNEETVEVLFPLGLFPALFPALFPKTPFLFPKTAQKMPLFPPLYTRNRKQPRRERFISLRALLGRSVSLFPLFPRETGSKWQCFAVSAENKIASAYHDANHTLFGYDFNDLTLFRRRTC